MHRLVTALTIGAALVGPAQAEPVRVVVNIENLAPANGTLQTPHWVGFHDGVFDIYDGGTPADNDPIANDPLRSVERLAEDGNTGPLSTTFQQLVAGGVDGTIAGPNGPLAPGESTRQQFLLDSYAPANRYFSYASMLLPSNDFWYANGNPQAHPVFDSNGQFIARDFIVNQDGVLDAGTEVNDEIPANTAFFGQAAADTGIDENGVILDFRDDEGNPQLSFLPPGAGGILDDPRFAMGDFALSGYPLVKISFSAAPAIVDNQDFPAELTGDQQNPPVATAAAGRALYNLRRNGTELFFHNRVSLPADQIVAGHLHLGAPGENGPVVAFLFNDDTREQRIFTAGPTRNGRVPTLLTRINGSLTGADLVGPLQGQPLDRLVAEIRAGNVYVNVHSQANPGGELRGQLQF